MAHLHLQLRVVRHFYPPSTPFKLQRQQDGISHMPQPHTIHQPWYLESPSMEVKHRQQSGYQEWLSCNGSGYNHKTFITSTFTIHKAGYRGKDMPCEKYITNRSRYYIHNEQWELQYTNSATNKAKQPTLVACTHQNKLFHKNNFLKIDTIFLIWQTPHAAVCQKEQPLGE